MPETNIEADLYDYFRHRVAHWVKYFKRNPDEAAGCFDITPADARAFIGTEKSTFDCSDDIMVASIGYAYRDWQRALENSQ